MERGMFMIYSMTGYGRFEIEQPSRKVITEIGSVNHRYLEINMRLSKELMQFEGHLKKQVKESVKRGKIEVNISIESSNNQALKIKLDEAKADMYLKACSQLSEKLGIENDIKLSHLMTLTDLIVVEKESICEEELLQQIEEALEGALKAFVEMRQREGEILKKDLLDKIISLDASIEFIKARGPLVVAQYKQKLEPRIKDMLHGVEIDESRLIQETALFADKCCIDEELTRLGSHMLQFKQIMETGGVVGRKLDFLIQEINREINTIGSKANDYEITKEVVQFKSEIEKIREQVQNIE